MRAFFLRPVAAFEFFVVEQCNPPEKRFHKISLSKVFILLALFEGSSLWPMKKEIPGPLK